MGRALEVGVGQSSGCGDDGIGTTSLSPSSTSLTSGSDSALSLLSSAASVGIATKELIPRP